LDDRYAGYPGVHDAMGMTGNDQIDGTGLDGISNPDDLAAADDPLAIRAGMCQQDGEVGAERTDLDEHVV
jgi:hypothetical protein